MDRSARCAWVVMTAVMVTGVADAGDDPFADAVVEYEAGRGAAAGFDDPATAVGAPERFTGEGVFPTVVSIFNPPFGTDEIVSIGTGGHLTLQFDTPVTDDADNPFGIDLIVFGNAFFVEGQGGINGLFGEGGAIEVSADGERWFAVDVPAASGLFPTHGYLDSGPYDDVPGAVETNLTRPVNPSLQLEQFMGLGFEKALAAYNGAGGGIGVDLASAGLEQVSFVRISNPAREGPAVEVDAIADVSPATPGDANGDGVANIDDLVAVLTQWGTTVPGTTADFNGDGYVDVDDLTTVILGWG